MPDKLPYLFMSNKDNIIAGFLRTKGHPDAPILTSFAELKEMVEDYETKIEELQKKVAKLRRQTYGKPNTAATNKSEQLS